MTSTKIVFLQYPNRIVVCESSTTPNCMDPETHDLREYARIVPFTAETGGIWVTRFQFAGDIEWTEHAHMLTPEHRAAIEEMAADYKVKFRIENGKARALQAYERVKYADKIAEYGE